MPRALSMGISGATAERFKELHDVSKLSYTQIIRKLMEIADDFYAQKKLMAEITLNLSKGMPHNLRAPPKTKTTTTVRKVVSIETYFTQETVEIKDDLKQELLQVVGMKPSEIAQLIKDKDAELVEKNGEDSGFL